MAERLRPTKPTRLTFLLLFLLLGCETAVIETEPITQIEYVMQANL